MIVMRIDSRWELSVASLPDALTRDISLVQGQHRKSKFILLPIFDIQEDYTLFSNRGRGEWKRERRHKKELDPA